MNAFLQLNDRILFQGDSITDAGRDRANPLDLGNGYPAIIKGILHARHPELNATVLNRGVGGDRTPELLARWDEDCVALRPDVLSIMIGVNDVWRIAGEWNGQKHVPRDAYAANLAQLLERAQAAGVARIVVMSPTTASPEADAMLNTMLADYAETARGVAQRFGARYADVRTPLLEARAKEPRIPWTPDGCHPSIAGHAVIAAAWLGAVGL
jgi:lysophospholipase L1-like esterase